MRFFTPRRLLRLYPGLFRLRYGTEFVALLEETPITRAVVFDTVRAAAWEWLRWTRIGRAGLALMLALPLTALEFLLNHRWPAPLYWVIDRPPTWSWFWVEALYFTAPLIAGIWMLAIATPPGRTGRHLSFATQIFVLVGAALASGWFLAVPDLLHRSVPTQLVQDWQRNTWFIGGFLVWLFNIEGGAKARYPRRLGLSGLDDDR